MPPYNPGYQMRDAMERWNSSSPADQNWAVSRGGGPAGESDNSAILDSPWQQYQRVLNFRGAQMNPRARMSGGQSASYQPEAPGPLTPADRPKPVGGGAERGTPISAEELAAMPRTGPQPWQPPSSLQGLQRAAGQAAQRLGQGAARIAGQR